MNRYFFLLLVTIIFTTNITQCFYLSHASRSKSASRVFLATVAAKIKYQRLRAINRNDHSLSSPETVDFNVNGVVNLDCKWCWGPVHNAKEVVSLSEWKNIAYNLKKLGTKSIVFTVVKPYSRKSCRIIFSLCEILNLIFAPRYQVMGYLWLEGSIYFALYR